jgi:hypothetical protein
MTLVTGVIVGLNNPMGVRNGYGWWSWIPTASYRALREEESHFLLGAGEELGSTG